MKLVAYPATGSAVYLTGSSLEEFVEGLEGPCEWIAQPRAGIGAAGMPQPLDLGNISNTLAFRVTRSHADSEEANIFYIDHPAQVPHLARVELQVVRPGGGVLARRSLEDAAIKVSRIRWHVCQTVMQYTISGGKITAG